MLLPPCGIMNKRTTSERLIAAAIVEFSQKGMQQANLRDICARAEVNLNAVRYHFGGKENLYVEAVKQAHRTMMGETPTPPHDSDPPQERLRLIISTMLNVAFGRGETSTPEQNLLLREIFEPTDATVQIARSRALPMFTALTGAIGELLPENTPQIECIMLATSLVGQCMHFKFGRHIDRLVIPKSEYRKYTIPRLTNHILRVTLAAINDLGDPGPSSHRV